MGARFRRLPARRQLRGNGKLPSESVDRLRLWRTFAADVWRCLGMDPQRLLSLPGVSRSAGRSRRVQREVYVQPICPARRLVCYVADPYPADLPEFFSARKALAVYGTPSRTRRFMNRRSSAAVLDLEPKQSEFQSEVMAGLATFPRTLPCKFFYDKTGAEFFQRICELPEYYITRTELQILQVHGQEMALHLGPEVELIGLGTGAGTKTKILLEQLQDPAVYIPVDI